MALDASPAGERAASSRGPLRLSLFAGGLSRESDETVGAELVPALEILEPLSLRWLCLAIGHSLLAARARQATHMVGTAVGGRSPARPVVDDRGPGARGLPSVVLSERCLSSA